MNRTNQTLPSTEKLKIKLRKTIDIRIQRAESSEKKGKMCVFISLSLCFFLHPGPSIKKLNIVRQLKAIEKRKWKKEKKNWVQYCHRLMLNEKQWILFYNLFWFAICFNFSAISNFAIQFLSPMILIIEWKIL